MAEVRRSVGVLTKKRVDDGATKRTLEQDLEAAQAAVEALEGEREYHIIYYNIVAYNTVM